MGADLPSSTWAVTGTRRSSCEGADLDILGDTAAAHQVGVDVVTPPRRKSSKNFLLVVKRHSPSRSLISVAAANWAFPMKSWQWRGSSR